jgi:hypothetical protein
MQKGVIPNEDVFKANSLTSKEAFNRIDDIVKNIKSKDLIIDLEPLFDNNIYINNWCNNFHSFYNKYRKKY